jgi:hypothetical protein
MFALADAESSGTITMEALEALLLSANETASYFGDVVVSKQQIHTAVLEVWAETAASAVTVSCAALISPLVQHAVMQQFCAGAGTERYNQSQ